MRTRLLILLGCCLPFSLMAHVGSPNVFFEGRAGEYPVYAVVRPPAALPGAAQVSVRIDSPAARAVSLLPVEWRAGQQGSPESIVAERVVGETSLWSAEVWFLYPGSYSLRLQITGDKGAGETAIPVNALARQGQPLKPFLRNALTLLALALVAGAVLIAGAVARDGFAEPALRRPDARRPLSRQAAGFALLLAVAGAAALAGRWRSMDATYRNQWVQKPEPVNAAVRVESQRTMLELQPAGQSMAAPSWAALLPEHGKLMHLFLIREPELDVFAHLHPVRLDARRFALELPPFPAGDYQLYGDITFENGLGQTLVARVKLPEPPGGTLTPPPLVTNLLGEVICGIPGALTNATEAGRDMEDSWHLDSGVKEISAGRGRVARLMGGYSLLFENAAAVIAGQETSLRFAVFAPDGREATLQTYMGMPGHAAVRHADGSVFAHLHPSGSYSMAAQEAFRQQDTGPASSTPAVAALPGTNRVSFPYQFPKPGAYRVWIQVRVAGRVLTGVFDLVIKAGA